MCENAPSGVGGRYSEPAMDAPPARAANRPATAPGSPPDLAVGAVPTPIAAAGPGTPATPSGHADPGDVSGCDAGGRAELYEVIFRRRDVRAEFTGAPVDGRVLARLLRAAHSAPSVGLSQPWDFLVVTDDDIRRAFWHHVQGERQVFADALDGELAERFAGIKIDGILEASLSMVVTYDPARGAPHVLGRHAIADAGLYSTCLAIENLWLACTAEGWGMGWVSFYREAFLRQLLGIPDGIRPVAWLCLGPVTHLQDVPDLERHGWRRRLPLEAVVHLDRWDGARARARELAGGSAGTVGGRVAAAPTSSNDRRGGQRDGSPSSGDAPTGTEGGSGGADGGQGAPGGIAGGQDSPAGGMP